MNIPLYLLHDKFQGLDNYNLRGITADLICGIIMAERVNNSQLSGKGYQKISYSQENGNQNPLYMEEIYLLDDNPIKYNKEIIEKLMPVSTQYYFVCEFLNERCKLKPIGCFLTYSHALKFIKDYYEIDYLDTEEDNCPVQISDGHNWIA